MVETKFKFEQLTIIIAKIIIIAKSSNLVNEESQN